MDNLKSKYLKIYEMLQNYEEDFLLINKSLSSILQKKYKKIFKALVLINEIKNQINYVINNKENKEYIINFYKYLENREKEPNIYYDVVINEVISIYEDNYHLEQKSDIKTLKYNDIEKNYKSFNNYIDLRIYYNSNNYLPSVNRAVEIINKKTINNEEIMIVFPLFLDEEKGIFNSKKQGYFKIYYEFSDYYEKLINEIIKTPNNITILLPNLMRYKDYISWEVVIKNVAKNHNRSVRVGLILDDYHMLIDLEENKLPEFVLIDYEEMNDNNNEGKTIDFKNFKGYFETKFRDIHAFLKNAKIEHYIFINRINNEQIIEKLIIMGFKKFIFDDEVYPALVNSINNHCSRRGIFKKNQTNIYI